MTKADKWGLRFIILVFSLCGATLMAMSIERRVAEYRREARTRKMLAEQEGEGLPTVEAEDWHLVYKPNISELIRDIELGNIHQASQKGGTLKGKYTSRTYKWADPEKTDKVLEEEAQAAKWGKEFVVAIPPNAEELIRRIRSIPGYTYAPR